MFFFFIHLHHVFFNMLLSVCHFTLIVQYAWWRVPFQSSLRLLSLGTKQMDGWNSMISTPVMSILTIHARGKTQTGVSQFCSSPMIQHSHGWVKSNEVSLQWCRFSKYTKRVGGGYVSRASIPSQQTAVPLWWRIWTEQRVHRRSPPLCCWGAYMAVLQPPRCRSPLGIWGQPYRRGPLWQRKNTERRALTSPLDQWFATTGIRLQHPGSMRRDCKVAQHIGEKNNRSYDLNSKIHQNINR